MLLSILPVGLNALLKILCALFRPMDSLSCSVCYYSLPGLFFYQSILSVCSTWPKALTLICVSSPSACTEFWIVECVIALCMNRYLRVELGLKELWVKKTEGALLLCYEHLWHPFFPFCCRLLHIAVLFHIAYWDGHDDDRANALMIRLLFGYLWQPLSPYCIKDPRLSTLCEEHRGCDLNGSNEARNINECSVYPFVWMNSLTGRVAGYKCTQRQNCRTLLGSRQGIWGKNQQHPRSYCKIKKKSNKTTSSSPKSLRILIMLHTISQNHQSLALCQADFPKWLKQCREKRLFIYKDLRF